MCYQYWPEHLTLPFLESEIGFSQRKGALDTLLIPETFVLSSIPRILFPGWILCDLIVWDWEKIADIVAFRFFKCP